MTPTPVDSAFITKIKEQNASHNLKMWKGTEAQYNALEEHDTDTLYIVGTNKVKSVDAIEYDVWALQNDVETLQEEVQPINRGGTNASNGEDALRNLGLSNMFKIKTFTTSSKSINSHDSEIFDINVSLTGYTAVAVVSAGFSDGIFGIVVSGVSANTYVSSLGFGNVYVEVYNTTSARDSVRVELKVLYLKD